jgi:stage IV sporulation protein B
MQNDGVYKLGVWIRDSAAGVGTVSFVDPKTGSFGGLGHGICDVDTGKLMPLGKASVYTASVDSVIAGKKGSPGELCAHFSSGTPWGDIYINSSYGVYGRLTDDFSSYKSYPVASFDEIHTGYATMITTVSGSVPKEYSVYIERVSSSSEGEKNFLIRITDEALLEASNGIVQGMSGSPLIQDGKIIGAVTHVLVNDPERGYGIFIRNMLKVSKDSEKIASSFQ